MSCSLENSQYSVRGWDATIGSVVVLAVLDVDPERQHCFGDYILHCCQRLGLKQRDIENYPMASCSGHDQLFRYLRVHHTRAR
jgi:hypothetical protein